ncbi:MAG: hypothetical protein RPU52_02470 [Candidatus Sedimenticola sp. (ex Thyasira tokunagai)]
MANVAQPSEEDLLASRNLKRIWEAKKKHLGLTQENIAQDLGFQTQGAVSHCLNATSILTAGLTIKFAMLLKVAPGDIDPRLAGVIAIPGKKNEREGVLQLLEFWLNADDRGREHILAVARNEADRYGDFVPQTPELSEE